MTATLLMSASVLASAAVAQPAILVTTGADSGPGSLRMALTEAATSEVPVPILVAADDDIEISSTLIYSGLAKLQIFGSGQVVRTDRNETLLALTEGADLSIFGLGFAGPGGFSIQQRGDLAGPGGKGIFIDVPGDRDGVVSLVLKDVSVSGVAYHGVHVSDCDLGDACGAGGGGSGHGSPASIHVRLENVEIRGVGVGRFDADGVRVDERGPGDIYFESTESQFSAVGADGVELDEGDDGSVFANIFGSTFSDNGGYCEPDVLKPLLPEPRDAEFDDGKATEADIPPEITGSPDDQCFERTVQLYPSGSVKSYEFEIDLDDGIDIDEAGDGDLRVSMVKSAIRHNLDEGVDLDEEDDGGAFVAFAGVVAENNEDDGFRLDESGVGDIEGLVFEVVARANGGNGVRFDEADAGRLAVLVERTETEKNDDGEDTGLRMTQSDDGMGTLTIRGSRIVDGIDARNVKVVDK